MYLVALLGLAVFCGLERAVKTSRGRRRRTSSEGSTSAGVFWLHTASFAVYNALIGYLLLHRGEPGVWSLILFAFTMGFVVDGYGLRKDHKESYDRIGWWILAGAVLVGWVIGLASVLGKALLTHSLSDHYKGLLPINRAV